MIPRDELAAEEAWTRFQELLREAATSAVQPRQMATEYTSLRDALLASDFRPLLPGFVIQCLTLDRFRDFIRLFHPLEDERIAFIDRSFSVRARRRRDFLADADF